VNDTFRPRLHYRQEPQVPCSDNQRRATYSADGLWISGPPLPEELTPVHLHSTNVLRIPCSPPGTRRWASHEVIHTGGSKQKPGRAGAGIFFPKSSDSKLGTSHSLPVEGALLKAAPVT